MLSRPGKGAQGTRNGRYDRAAAPSRSEEVYRLGCISDDITTHVELSFVNKDLFS